LTAVSGNNALVIFTTIHVLVRGIVRQTALGLLGSTTFSKCVVFVYYVYSEILIELLPQRNVEQNNIEVKSIFLCRPTSE